MRDGPQLSWVDINKEDGMIIGVMFAILVGVILGLAIENQWGWLRKIRKR